MRSLRVATVLALLCAAFPVFAQRPIVVKAAPPELQERPAADWINSVPLKLSELHGQVVVLHFWTFGCINCIHNQPTYKGWHAKYSQKGVTLIGVHTPETEREKNLDNVRESVKKSGLNYPIVFDRDAKIWKAWRNRWWPCTYLIDKNGFVRYRWDGEFRWKGTNGEQIMQKKIDALLAERGSNDKRSIAARKSGRPLDDSQ
jgi:peroxiredoxin